MSKNKPQAVTPKVNGVFYAVGKDSHLLYSAFEIEVKDGVVTGVKNLSRAPDMAAAAVSICTREIAGALRNQLSSNIEG